jgi:hypothetical protein
MFWLWIYVAFLLGAVFGVLLAAVMARSRDDRGGKTDAYHGREWIP